MKLRKGITKKEIMDFCNGQFYSEGSEHWEPIEHYPKESVREFVREMASNLEYFLKDKGEK